ncbi:MAG: ribonuclease HII [Bacteroidales bacterium]|nr:ribonuclease HII [Bacteroidales bacterium]
MAARSNGKSTSEALAEILGAEGGGLFGQVRYSVIAGCDEAGRGPLAGPVFAGAVILPEDFRHPWLADSKQLTKLRREQMRPIIESNAIAWGVASVSAAEIDEINILNASIKAMHLAIAKLGIVPELILADGNRFKPYYGPDGAEIPYMTVVKGDAKIPAISAASILAKTYRDEYMTAMAEKYPGYGWERNMAYPTKEHYEAIAALGITPEHRKSFLKNIKY